MSFIARMFCRGPRNKGVPRHRPRPRAFPTRFTLEVLEDRTVPVVIVGDLLPPPVPPADLPPAIMPEVPPVLPADVPPETPPEGEFLSVDPVAFLDFNANGVMDEGETGLEGVLVGLAALDGSLQISYQDFLVTDANGKGWFFGAPAGTVYVSAMAPEGYLLTSPATVAVTGGAGDAVQVFFGFTV